MSPPVRLARILECVTLFLGLPTVYILAPKLGLPQPGVIPMLGITVVLCLLIFRLHRIPPRDDVRPRTPRQEVKRVLLLFALLSAGIVVVVALTAPQMLLSLPRTNTRLWMMIMVFYPLVSVLPQEFMYRRFFFRRYQDALGGPWPTIVLSAALFGYVHLLFGSWISVAMTLLGGTLFAITYHRTRSLLACSVEHALYGCFVFTIGLGQFFYYSGANPSDQRALLDANIQARAIAQTPLADGDARRDQPNTLTFELTADRPAPR